MINGSYYLGPAMISILEVEEDAALSKSKLHRCKVVLKDGRKATGVFHNSVISTIIQTLEQIYERPLILADRGQFVNYSTYPISIENILSNLFKEKRFDLAGYLNYMASLG